MWFFYVIIGIFLVLSIYFTLRHLLVLKNYYPPKKENYDIKPYVAIRTRGSVRQAMGRIKSIDDYYVLEKKIKFSKK